MSHSSKKRSTEQPPTPKDEALAWLAGFAAGVTGEGFPANRPLQPAPDPMPGAAKIHEMLLLVRLAINIPSERPIGEADAVMWTTARSAPPASATCWYQLGLQIRAWYEAYEEELKRCVGEHRERPGLDRSDNISLALRAFRDPPLQGVVNACRKVVECGEARLYTARLIVKSLAAGRENQWWGELQKIGYRDNSSGRDAGALLTIGQIERHLRRDLIFVACGRTPHPRWRPEVGELSLNDVVLKKIAVGRAVNVAWILKQFEESGWPETIRAAELKDDQLHQTLRSLNKGLTSLRFHSNGDGSAIRWELTAG
jgi:hypothetical protein